MQQDALQRLNLTQMLMEPEILETVDVDVHLVATLLTLSKVIPEKTKDTARQAVRLPTCTRVATSKRCCAEPLNWWPAASRSSAC